MVQRAGLCLLFSFAHFERLLLCTRHCGSLPSGVRAARPGARGGPDKHYCGTGCQLAHPRHHPSHQPLPACNSPRPALPSHLFCRSGCAASCSQVRWGGVRARFVPQSSSTSPVAHERAHMPLLLLLSTIDSAPPSRLPAPPAAVGLPPNWRPPPELAPDLPPCRPEECSRYGRRRRRVASYALPDSSSEDEEEESGSERSRSPAPRAIRRRTSSASLASARREGSADSAGAGVRPTSTPASAPAAESAGWRSDGPACSGAGTGSAGSPGSAGTSAAAIFAMQARAAAAFASQPAAPAAPSLMVPVHSAPQQPLSAVALPPGQPARASSPTALPPLSLVPLVPAAPAAQPLADSWNMASQPGMAHRLMAPPQRAQPPMAPSLATLLSNPGQAAAPAPAPLAEQLLQPASALDSLSAQLHTLFEDWEAGQVSLLSFGAL